MNAQLREHENGPPQEQDAERAPWALDVDAIAREWDTDEDAGLSDAEAKARLESHGYNRIQRGAQRSAWSIFVDQFRSLVVLLLVAAAIAAFAMGDTIEGIAVAVVVVVNAAIGFFTELRARRSMEALLELGAATATVVRDGEPRSIEGSEVVPGDLLVLEAGQVCVADGRLVEANRLQVDESSLTGESVPRAKQTEAMDPETPLPERDSMVYKGTAITRGSGHAVVVGTGMDTELGNIATLTSETEGEITPLEQRLEVLGRHLAWITLALVAVLAVAGALVGKDLRLMIETAVALAVAAVPEGLPIVATVVLARGMGRMARRNAIMKELAAVEALGATSVICADKTGTLTANRMTLTELRLPTGLLEITGGGETNEGKFITGEGEEFWPADGPPAEALRLAALCTDASVRFDDEGKVDDSTGDPIEVALLVAAAKAGWRYSALTEEWPEVREEAFDPDLKMMATVHDVGGAYRVAVKGAPGAVLERCTRIREDAGETKEMSDKLREQWSTANLEMAEEGQRVLALATKDMDSEDGDVYADLVFIGLVGMIDPPRESVREPLEECKSAGITVIMATGDQPATAGSVAEDVGLVDDEDATVITGSELEDPEDMDQEAEDRLAESSIVARVSPEQKLDLIDLHQSRGAIVAMTGDGVNDAPALKKADIGVAMGRGGSQVAQEAADMVLLDNAFSSIVDAVHEGRVIFENLRRFVIYLLSCNIAEILVVAAASLVNAPLPLMPLQILFLNLVTDVFPALALGVGEGPDDIMERRPRDSDEPIMGRSQWLTTAGYGATISVAVLAAFAIALGPMDLEVATAVTMSFLTLALAQLWHAFNMRAASSGLLRNDVVRNPYVWGALALCVLMLIAAIYIGPVAHVLSLVPLEGIQWAVVLVASFFPLLVGQVAKAFAE
ncbi:MAG: HAD-IC family P-type ATPase [Armatimonadia bacterium]|nr:HAD-IC family P-type ATPase [Armatimonadia bacterium]